MSKREEEEIIDEVLSSIFEAFSSVPVKVVTVRKPATKAAEKTTKKTTETVKERATSCSRTKNSEPKLTDFIDKVICQDSAVVIFWKDGTKTTAKCGANDVFDYEKGLAIATLKYVFGNKVYQVDMKEIMEAYPHANTIAKKKMTTSEASKKTMTTKMSTSKKSSSSKKSSK